MKSGIYCIRNLINGRRYIGSAKNFRIRWNKHLNELTKDKHGNKRLQNSFNKHGLKNFVFEILELVPYEKEIIVKRENYFIEYYNSKIDGYNIADALFGDVITNNPNREDIIKKSRETQRLTLSNLTHEQRQDKWAKKKEKNPFYGKKHSIEIVNAMRNNSQCRITIVDGVEYQSLAEASRITGIKVMTIWHRIKSDSNRFIQTYYKDEPK